MNRCLPAIGFALLACAAEGPTTLPPDSVEVIGGAPIPAWDRTWPDGWGDLPTCPEPAVRLDSTPPAEPSGLVRSYPETQWLPVGARLGATVVVYAPGGDDGDDAYNGTVTVVSEPAGVVAEPFQVVAGRGELSLRVPAAGDYIVALEADNGRTGAMPLYVYESPLPVYEIDLAAADWDEMTADPYTTRTAPATLTIGGGKPRQGTARLRGGSSRDLLKPSLQFRLDEPDEGEARVVVLRAEWVDKTMLRNHLSMELLRRSTWLPASATEFVHGRVNGRPKGLMLRTERLDDDFLEARGLDENAALYEADPPAGIKGGANLMPADPAVYETLYEKQVGPPGYDDLIALIDAAIPGGDVAAAVSVDDLVPLLAFWAVIQDADHVRKNYDLFRNPAFLSGRFVFIPWDLDLTWGHLWTEAEDVMDETIFVDLDPRTGSSAVTPGSRTA